MCIQFQLSTFATTSSAYYQTKFWQITCAVCFFVSIETENWFSILRCSKTSIRSLPLNKALKDWFPYVVFGRDYGHYPAQFEANIMAKKFPLYCTLRKEEHPSGYTNIVKKLHIPCMSIYCGQMFTLKYMDLVWICMIFFLLINFHLHNEYSCLWLCSQSTCLV